MTTAPLGTWQGADVEALRIRWGLAALRCYRVVDSTNDVARALAEAGARPGTVVLADAQRTGRGRAGRSWASPAGRGLWMSALLPGSTAAATLPLAVGLAVARALDEFVAPERCGLKWPNDLMLRDRKLGGILCEGSWDATGAGFVVAGVGINVRQRQEEFPAAVASRATSLELASGREVKLLAVAEAAVPAVAGLARSGAVLDEQRLSEVRARDVLLGRRIEVREPVTGALVARGVAAGLDDDGALLLRVAGALHRVHSGSVVLLETGPASAAGALHRAPP